jgi:hypothetical protein
VAGLVVVEVTREVVDVSEAAAVDAGRHSLVDVRAEC